MTPTTSEDSCQPWLPLKLTKMLAIYIKKCFQRKDTQAFRSFQLVHIPSSLFLSQCGFRFTFLKLLSPLYRIGIIGNRHAHGAPRQSNNNPFAVKYSANTKFVAVEVSRLLTSLRC